MYRIKKVGKSRKACEGDPLLELEIGESVDVGSLDEVAWQLSGGGFEVEILDDEPEPSEESEAWDS